MVFRLGKRPFVQGDTMAEQNRRRFYADILIGRRSVGFKLIGLISAFLLLFFVMSYTVTSGESAPEFDEKGFLFGSIPMIYVDEVMQPLPPIKYGFADYDAEPILKKCGGFYLAKRVIYCTDFPDFLSSINHDYPHPNPRNVYINPMTMAFFLEYLNDNFIPLDDGKRLKGYYSIPTAEDLLAAVFRGKRYSKVNPEGNQFEFRIELLATRFISSVPAIREVFSYKHPSEYTEPACRKELLCSVSPEELHLPFIFPDIRNYQDYCGQRLMELRPLLFSLLNTGVFFGSVRIKLNVVKEVGNE